VCLEFHMRRNLWVCSISRASIVCIETRYGLDSLGIESQWGARFSMSAQTGTGA
jgi:hypothetical protein